MFANASAERPALHFTVLGEPPLKMLRYQQQFDFFDPAKVESVIRYRNLSEEVLSGDLARVLDAIVTEVDRAEPEIVVVDSFRTVVRSTERRDRAARWPCRASCSSSPSTWRAGRPPPS